MYLSNIKNSNNTVKNKETLIYTKPSELLTFEQKEELVRLHDKIILYPKATPQ